MNGKLKQRTCANKGCKVKFTQFNSIQTWCSPKCGQEIAQAKVKINYKKETTRLKKELNDNSRPYQIKKAVEACNKYIRARDSHQPCISCGTTKPVQYCAGHLKTAGGHPELRFNELNIHKQCNKHCNMELSGNIGAYRPALINRIGIEKVEWIEGPHKPQNLTIDDIKGVIWWYKLKLKLLEQGDLVA